MIELSRSTVFVCVESMLFVMVAKAKVTPNTCYINIPIALVIEIHQEPQLLTWFNFTLSMNK